MSGLNLSRKLLLKLVVSVVCAFVVTMVATALVQVAIAERNAMKAIERTLDDVQGDIEEWVNRKLILAAMTARDRLSELPDTSVETLRALATELRVDDVSVVDERGVLVAGVHPDEIGFDFHDGDGQAREFLCLLDTESEFCQSLRPSSVTGEIRKYVGVWRPQGGFVQVGCFQDTLRVFAQSTVAGLTHNWHIGGTGTIVIATDDGQILSDAIETGQEGSVLHLPKKDEAYVVKRVIEGFDVYAILPKDVAARERNTLIGTSAVMTMLALCFVAVLVGLAISRFVREQVENRLRAEMEMAKSIQSGCLPSVFPPFPEKVEMFDLFALMRTAKEVGGDFYDFFVVGRDRLALVMADVSGKGIPAAMFMMRAKTAIRGYLQAGKDVADLMGKVNEVLCDGNDSFMFVTAWVGIVNLTDGTVEYVNAGHNPPLVKRRDGSVAWLTERSGAALAVFPGAAYRLRTVRLAPGESLFLYTDGVTEATNAVGEFLDEPRLEKELASSPDDAQARCRHVLAAIDAFAGTAPQADDITMLAFTLKAAEMTFPAVDASLGVCADWISEVFHSPEPSIIVDEIVSNIIRCSGATTFTIQVKASNELVVTDDGKPFDPTAMPDPDVTLKAEDRGIGGLGIYLVKKMSKSLDYARLGEANRLHVVL